MSQEIRIFKNEQTGKHIARVDDHLILFKSAKEKAYTLYLEDSIDLENNFHKSYFDEGEYDYWENSEFDHIEESRHIWNCRTNEWEDSQ